MQKSEQRQAIALFAVVVLASSVGNLAQTGLNAMLSSICAEFGIVEGVGQWLTTSYMLVLGIVVPLSSYFMGRFRLKDLTLLAIALFAVGALVSASASNFAMLFAGRLAQAVAAGMLLPLVQTIHDTLSRWAKSNRHGHFGHCYGVCAECRPHNWRRDGGRPWLAKLLLAACRTDRCCWNRLPVCREAP